MSFNDECCRCGQPSKWCSCAELEDSLEPQCEAWAVEEQMRREKREALGFHDDPSDDFFCLECGYTHCECEPIVTIIYPGGLKISF